MPSGEVRLSPLASGVLSRARIAARGGRVVRRLSCSPVRRPGHVSRGVQAIRALSPLPLTGMRATAAMVPKMRVRTRTGTSLTSSCRPPARPVSIATVVAVASVAR